MTPQERRQTILTLLDHWPDFFDRANPGDKSLPTEPAALLDPQAWSLFSSMGAHPSVVELGRLLRALHDMERPPRALSRSTLEHWGAPWRTIDRPMRRKTVGGRSVVEMRRVRERVLTSYLRLYPTCGCGCGLPRPVCLAVDVMAGAWDRSVPLELPWPLLVKLRPLVDSEGWTEAA